MIVHHAQAGFPALAQAPQEAQRILPQARPGVLQSRGEHAALLDEGSFQGVEELALVGAEGKDARQWAGTR